MAIHTQFSAPPPLAALDHAFFLDIDGTLLEIAPTPSAVRVDSQLGPLIARLHEAAAGALALISGRRIADIDALFPALALPVAGQHGIERRDATGSIHHHSPPQRELDLMRREMAALAAAHPGVLFEDKGATLALHFRAVPAAGAPLRDALEPLLAALGADFRLQPGKMVLELKPAGKDKGTAVAEFLQEAPFAGRRPVFLGDDVTDEYGFRVVDARGGYAVKVGEGDSAAPWRLADVSAVRRWLGACVATTDDEMARGGGE